MGQCSHSSPLAMERLDAVRAPPRNGPWSPSLLPMVPMPPSTARRSKGADWWVMGLLLSLQRSRFCMIPALLLNVPPWETGQRGWGRRYVCPCVEKKNLRWLPRLSWAIAQLPIFPPLRLLELNINRPRCHRLKHKPPDIVPKPSRCQQHRIIMMYH